MCVKPYQTRPVASQSLSSQFPSPFHDIASSPGSPYNLALPIPFETIANFLMSKRSDHRSSLRSLSIKRDSLGNKSKHRCVIKKTVKLTKKPVS